MQHDEFCSKESSAVNTKNNAVLRLAKNVFGKQSILEFVFLITRSKNQLPEKLVPRSSSIC
jgi:hypothetical protein